MGVIEDSAWVFLAIGTAFFESTKNVFSKLSLDKAHVFTVSWATRFFAVLALLPFTFYVEFPEITLHFIGILVMSTALSTFNITLFMKAVKAGDLSQTEPIMNFTPVFLLLTSALILGETPSGFGLLGIFLSTFGAYWLNWTPGNPLFEPFRAIFRSKGPRMMLAVAFLASITVSFDKIGIQATNSIFWALSVNALLALIFFTFLLTQVEAPLQNFWAVRNRLLIAGVFNGLGTLCQMLAIEMALVSYVIAIKRTSAVFSVLYGFYIFREKNVKYRLIGTIFMIIGVIIIILTKQ